MLIMLSAHALTVLLNNFLYFLFRTINLQEQNAFKNAPPRTQMCFLLCLESA